LDVPLAREPVPKPKVQFPDSVPIGLYASPEPVPVKAISPPEGSIPEATTVAGATKVHAFESSRLPKAVTTTPLPVSVKLKVRTPAGSGRAQTLAKARARREERRFMAGYELRAGGGGISDEITAQAGARE
jgi:hypothetical protein